MTEPGNQSFERAFFGPFTPYAAIASLTLALLATSYLWVLGIVLNGVLVLVGVTMMGTYGRTRQIGSGVTAGYLVFMLGLGLIILVDYLKTR